MYNAGKIITGLAIFAAAVTLPFWYNAAVGSAAEPPVLNFDTPAIKALKAPECVEPAAFMRTNHMDLLVDWRDQAVRHGNRTYTSTTGKQFEISLQNTCLNCHSNERGTEREGGQFCTTCHTYTDVKIDCWSCHVQSKGGGQ